MRGCMGSYPLFFPCWNTDAQIVIFKPVICVSRNALPIYDVPIQKITPMDYTTRNGQMVPVKINKKLVPVLLSLSIYNWYQQCYNDDCQRDIAC